MKKLKPQSYIDIPESEVSQKTTINWVKRGKIKGEQIPIGRWLVLVKKDNKNSSSSILNG